MLQFRIFIASGEVIASQKVRYSGCNAPWLVALELFLFGYWFLTGFGDPSIFEFELI